MQSSLPPRASIPFWARFTVHTIFNLLFFLLFLSMWLFSLQLSIVPGSWLTNCVGDESSESADERLWFIRTEATVFIFAALSGSCRSSSVKREQAPKNCGYVCNNELSRVCVCVRVRVCVCVRVSARALFNFSHIVFSKLTATKRRDDGLFCFTKVKKISQQFINCQK